MGRCREQCSRLWEQQVQSGQTHQGTLGLGFCSEWPHLTWFLSTERTSTSLWEARVPLRSCVGLPSFSLTREGIPRLQASTVYATERILRLLPSLTRQASLLSCGGQRESGGLKDAWQAERLQAGWLLHGCHACCGSQAGCSVAARCNMTFCAVRGAPRTLVPTILAPSFLL